MVLYILLSKDSVSAKELTKNSIFIGIMLKSVLPFITNNEEDIRKLVNLAYVNGAKFIHTYMGMTLRGNQRDYYKKIDGNFNNLSEKYGILYNMEDIITSYKKVEIKMNKHLYLKKI